MSTENKSFEGWTNEQLADYESDLYERETRGEDTWDLRDEVIWEMNSRDGLISRKPLA
jgi:hypothetical protein